MTIFIAGGGIAGLTLGLTLHQIGIPFRLFEASPEIRPLGVGINLQPNAVRELHDLGLEQALGRIGVKTRQYGFYTKHGLTIWQEPRGTWVGYAWPQYSVHRGQLQMMLYHTLLDRAGPDAVTTGARVTGYDQDDTGATLRFADGSSARGALVIAADGIHSALRAQMYPNEGAPIWNGQTLWRATTRAPVFLDGGAMCLIGHDSLRFVAYPISDPDPDTGLATINWIAEKRFDPAQGFRKEDYNRTIDKAEFLPAFESWKFDWINPYQLIQGAGEIYEFPMVDRDPLARWTFGRLTLIGDAAHPTYPVGSNGASQAIVDSRVLGAALLDLGLTNAALQNFEDQTRPMTNAIGLANRKGSGPDAVLQWVEDLCGGQFDEINDVIPHAELAAHAAKYKSMSGFSIDALNAKPPLIAPGARADQR